MNDYTPPPLRPGPAGCWVNGSDSMAGAFLDVHFDLDASTLTDLPRCIAEVSRHEAERLATQHGWHLRHLEPREVVTKQTGDVMQVASRWVVD